MESAAEAVREALTRKPAGLISIQSLAGLLEVSVERLRPLVEHKYFRVVKADQDFTKTIVTLPGQRALEWLMNMFRPLTMRPLIPLKEAGKLWGITEREVFKICWTYKIPVNSDAAFGELITFGSLKSLARARAKYHKPKRFDRASLLRYYLSQIDGVRWKEPPPYSEALEEEIARVARLPEPTRTVRCMELVLAFRDVKTVVQCAQGQRTSTHNLRNSENKLGNLLRKCVGLELADIGF